MYSVLLAALLTTGGQQTQAWHPQRASCLGSCYGSCSGSCHGGSCFGSCHGGSCHGWGHGGLFSRLHASHSCGGNYGCAGFTGYTVGYNNWASGCYGSSCFGGCYGQVSIGCFGWTGGYAAAPVVGAPQFTEGEYYYGQNAIPLPVQGGAYSPPSAGSPVPSPVVPPAAPIGDRVPPLRPMPEAPKAPGLPEVPKVNIQTNFVESNKATVVMLVPADAKVWVDQVPCPLEGSMRSFNTPNLLPGAQYAYTITVETPNGSREERRVSMTAGRTVEVDFRGMGIETVSK